ncbi:hypothetical protein QTP86_007092 [Hemibagrus guttatus]|nr:hypothetical protein QTP86_007092 [Hemibagrus guttatus]
MAEPSGTGPRHPAGRILLSSPYGQSTGIGEVKEVQREVTCWTDQSVAALQDALDDADWDMFRCSSDDINVLTEAVVGFVGKLADDTVKKNNQNDFSDERSRAAAYNVGLANW